MKKKKQEKVCSDAISDEPPWNSSVIHYFTLTTLYVNR